MSKKPLPGDIVELLSQLNDPLPSSRGLAATMLAEQADYATAIIPVLKSALASDSSPYVRASAAYAIARLAPVDQTGVAALVQLLRDDDAHGRWTSASLLSELGSAALDALPAMIAALKDSNAGVRFHAAGYLAQRTHASYVAIPDLISLLQDDDSDVQEQAATAIGNLALAGYRTQLSLAVPLLLALVNNPATLNRPLFMHVVFDIGPTNPLVQQTLTHLLHDDNYDVKNNAKQILGILPESHGD